MAATELRLRDEHDLVAQERAQQQEIARWGTVGPAEQGEQGSKGSGKRQNGIFGNGLGLSDLVEH